MALDDLVRIGSQSKKAEKAKAEYDKDRSNNLTLDVAKISGIERANPLFFNLIKAASPNYTESKHGTEYKAFIGGQRDLSFAEVEVNPSEAFQGIRDDKLAPYLLDRSPVKYDGVNEQVLDGHALAYESIKFKKDDGAKKKKSKEIMGVMTKELQANKINPAILKLANSIAKETGFAEVISQLEAQADAAISAFSSVNPNSLRGYALGRYQSLADGVRPGEAYEIAKAVADSS